MKRHPIYVAFAIIAAICAGWFAFHATTKFIQNLPPEITRAELMSEVDQGHVARIVVEADLKSLSGVSSTRGPFRTTMPVVFRVPAP